MKKPTVVLIGVSVAALAGVLIYRHVKNKSTTVKQPANVVVPTIGQPNKTIVAALAYYPDTTIPKATTDYIPAIQPIPIFQAEPKFQQAVAGLLSGLR